MISSRDNWFIQSLSCRYSSGGENSRYLACESAFSKLKALLRTRAETTIAALWDAVGAILHRFTPANAPTNSRAAGYEPD